MNAATTFCVECCRNCSYDIITSREQATVRGLNFNYIKQTAYCSICGEPVYVPEINDENVRTQEESFRIAAHLITIEQINRILEIYDIGAGPLAKLLGFGEVTINRYLCGQLPSKSHSDRLITLLTHPKEFELLLDRNYDLITPVAYKKCKIAIEKHKQFYGKKKIDFVIQYLLSKESDISHLALQKLLYYIQAFYYSIFGTEIFSDNCYAWMHGPVFPDVYSRYKEYGCEPITIMSTDFSDVVSELSEDEIAVINAVESSFGQYSGTVLRKFTHNESPWIEARGSLLPTDKCSNIINREQINKYFESVVNKYHINEPSDISVYCKSMYESLYF